MKHPKLMFRYAEGLGDFTACFLHSKPIGWLTKLLTGKDEPCKTCSERIVALNFLFPIPFWRLFFKERQALLKSLQEDLKNYGYNLNRPTITSEPIVTPNVPKPIVEDNIEGYKMISSSDNQLGEYLVRVQTFKIK